MSAISLDSLNTLYNLEERNRLAMLKVTEYAIPHGVFDATVGGITGFFGLGAVGLVSTVALQVPVYQCLVRDLGLIYSAPPDRLTNYLVLEGAAIGGVAMLASDLGVSFLREIAWDILKENGFGAILSSVPIFGAFAAAGLDFAVAATMTWRVGAMASLYFQNEYQLIGSKKNTYKLAKGWTGGVSPETDKRVNFNNIPQWVPEVGEKQIKTAMGLLQMLRSMNQNATEEMLREAIKPHQLPTHAVDEAFRRSRKQPG